MSEWGVSEREIHTRDDTTTLSLSRTPARAHTHTHTHTHTQAMGLGVYRLQPGGFGEGFVRACVHSPSLPASLSPYLPLPLSLPPSLLTSLLPSLLRFLFSCSLSLFLTLPPSRPPSLSQVKMNILLFAPGLLYLLLCSQGVYKTLLLISLCALIQV